MTVLKNLLMLFFIPAFVDIIYKSVNQRMDFDFVLIVVAVVTSIVGSTVQISHKNLEKPILKKEVFAIYTTSAMVAIVSYFIGVYTNKLFVTALVGAIASYMSLQLFKGVEKAVLGIISFIPKAFEMWVKNKYDIKDKDDD